MEPSSNSKPWEDSGSCSKPLRRPKCTSVNELPKTNSNTQESSNSNNSAANKSTQKSIDVKKSTLSVDAKEWYPASYSGPVAPSNAPKNSVQNRLSMFKKPTENKTPHETYHNNESDNNTLLYNDEVVNQDINRLQHVIDTLTYDPGQFDDLLEIFEESYRPHTNDISVSSTLAEMLFRQSVKEPNFRYTGARLSGIIERNAPLFRSELHLICSRALTEKNVDLQGLALFLAELYLQLHYENLYGKCLIDALTNLLNSGDDCNIKCVCQALKLTGCSLELYNSNAIDELFSKLNNLRGSLSPSVANCLNSVVKLRNERWGVSSISSSNDSSPAPTPSEPNYTFSEEDGMVFYNPSDGLELSADEKVFFAGNCPSGYNIDIDDVSDPDDLCDPEPEMDEEIRVAFKEFQRMSKK